MPESQENYRKPQSIKNRRRLRNSRRFKGRRSGQKAAGAKSRLRRFRQATFLAVVITTLLLLVLEPGGAETVQNDTLPQTPDTVSVIEDIPVEDLIEQRAEKEVEEVDEPVDPVETVSEAWMTIRELVKAFYRNLPRFIIALLIIVFTYFLTKGFNYITKKTIGNWERSHGIIAVVGVFIWLIAISIIFGVLSGDIRALIGSLGLVGLALSWALQTPIESFTGWLLNSFQGYYRIGDRIVVGEVFGDVYKIDFLTTTVWEVGAPYRPGFVQAEQPTGRLVTFPNNEVLAGTIINLTRDFPYVWDELAIQITNESDMHLALSAMEKATNQLLGQQMIQPSRTYSEILIKAGLDFENVPEKPQVFLSINESWTDVVVRYLVHARERRKWKSRLVLDIWEELNREEYKGKVKAAYSRHQIEMISMTGSAKKFGM